MGEVYCAYDRRLERRVALKQIRPEAISRRARRRFWREARAAARLNHPAIIQIYDVLEAGGCDWIVMELVEGTPLDELVASGPLRLGRFLDVAAELAAGLTAAHSESIIHRDLKANNVILTRQDRVKILDFGLAKPLKPRHGDATVSLPGQLLGTPQAMSPEQASGGEVDHRSDLFSLGTLFYEMLTGISPFVDTSAVRTLTRVCTHHQTPVCKVNRAVPRRLSELVDRLLEKDPAHRPAAAVDVAETLQHVRLPSASEPESNEVPTLAQVETFYRDDASEPAGQTRPKTVERRQLTVMCCELIDAGGADTAFDPEAFYEVVPEFQALIGDAVERFEGHLASAIGHRAIVWQLAQASQGQAVLVSGEAGIGKSRLVAAFEESLVSEADSPLICFGSPYAHSSPLQPFIELLRQILELPRGGSPARHLQQLELALDRLGCPLPRSVPLFASLLGLPTGSDYPVLGLDPEKLRQQTLEAILDLVLRIADRQPTVLVVEDLHWLDPSSLKLLGLLLDQAATSPLLLLLTFRKGFQAPWGNRTYLTQLNLHRLSDTDVERLIDQVAGSDGLPAPVRRQIVARADGVPLFAEELTRSVLESDLRSAFESQDYSSITPLDIPHTLRDSLTARLDRLGPAKEVAQLASVIGREFSYELLAAVSRRDPMRLEAELDRLVRVELVQRQGLGEGARYVFRHALLQETAYRSLLQRTRKRWHHEIAQVLETRFSGSFAQDATDVAPPDDRILALLAHHWRHTLDADRARPELVHKAVAYLTRAGELKITQSAYEEAFSCLQEALEVVGWLGQGEERDELELAIRLKLATVLEAKLGWTSSETQRTHERIRQLCSELGEPCELSPEAPSPPVTGFGSRTA